MYFYFFITFRKKLVTKLKRKTTNFLLSRFYHIPPTVHRVRGYIILPRHSRRRLQIALNEIRVINHFIALYRSLPATLIYTYIYIYDII